MPFSSRKGENKPKPAYKTNQVSTGTIPMFPEEIYAPASPCWRKSWNYWNYAILNRSVFSSCTPERFFPSSYETFTILKAFTTFSHDQNFLVIVQQASKSINQPLTTFWGVGPLQNKNLLKSIPFIYTYLLQMYPVISRSSVDLPQMYFTVLIFANHKLPPHPISVFKRGQKQQGQLCCNTHLPPAAKSKHRPREMASESLEVICSISAQLDGPAAWVPAPISNRKQKKWSVTAEGRKQACLHRNKSRYF